MRTIDLRDHEYTGAELMQLVPRAVFDASAASIQVQPLLDAVRTTGTKALRAQAENFDGVVGHELRVPQEIIENAVEAADPQLKTALEKMIARVRLASQAQVPQPVTTNLPGGGKVTQRWQPVSRVGLYVPGGKAVYPSSVIMNAIPALVAGVESLAIASPVQAETGSVHPTILLAAALCGVREVYAIGGAGAIAAFAYGVPEIGLDPVDIVTGPGNIFVAAAKRMVNGLVGIDAEAGTTEIMVLADESANAQYVAADLLSQAEHDENAASILVTNNVDFAAACQEQLQLLLAATPNRERAQKALTGVQSAIILVADYAQMIAVADAYAAEHLEVHTVNAQELASKINNAGAIFVGDYSPVSLGDYMAGSNHVLPTGGTGRFASGLGAYTFLRAQQIISYAKADLAGVADNLVVLAQAEGLPAHAQAAQIRLEKK